METKDGIIEVDVSEATKGAKIIARSGPLLKPCPFCGREPYIHEPSFKGARYQIGCDCGEDTEDGDKDPEIGAVWRDGKTLEEVVERWNERAEFEWRGPWVSDVPRSDLHGDLARDLEEVAIASLDDALDTVEASVKRARERLDAFTRGQGRIDLFGIPRISYIVGQTLHDLAWGMSNASPRLQRAMTDAAKCIAAHEREKSEPEGDDS